MPLFKINSSVVHFVHIPKTGGTSIEKWFSELYPSLFLNGKLQGVTSTLQHLDASQYIKIFSEWPDFEFAVVRNPYSRLISAYRWRYSKAASDGNYVPPFKLWLIFKLRAAINNNRLDDNFYISQVDFVRDNTEIYYFEDGLDNVKKDVCKKLGVSSQGPLPHFYKTEKLHIELDDECVDIIRNRYKKDFSELCYSENFEPTSFSGCEMVPCNIDVSKMVLGELRNGLLNSALKYFVKRSIQWRSK